MTDTISKDKIVSLHYTLKNSQGEVLDQSDAEDTFDYLHGAQNIVPGLERQLEGKKVGDKLNAVVPPHEAYGERSGEPPQAVPKEHFPEEIEEGMQLMAEDDKGHAIPIWVAKIEGNKVFIDVNHPLAGETLHFDVEVKAIRKASKEEMEHGHPHGPGGHHH
jgi:FKBP-type peptidyl-prolyl cis-trans isomerase SlyD